MSCEHIAAAGDPGAVALNLTIFTPESPAKVGPYDKRVLRRPVKKLIKILRVS